MKKSILWLLALAFALAPSLASGVEIDSNSFGGLRARSIGPAIMGGRVTSMDATGTNPNIIYVGSASGGLWKSTDGGVSFTPIFDDYNQSIGAVTLDPSDSETVWVGTGEPWTRNSTSVGDGVYKSTDGGATWTHVGLADSERISRIRVDPRNSDTVYVCSVGRLWSAGGERGVYKTTDGGESWEAILTVDEDTGCASMTLDPQDPDRLYAGMWQFRRYPDFFESGGPGSGLYRSTDGGANWEELREGLPSGTLGRIAVEVAPSRPSTLYAVVESEEQTALYRSQDLGSTWEFRNTSMNVAIRPFYFSYLVVDPKDHNLVYKPGFTLSVSQDGGSSFTNPFAGGGFGFSVHPDHHALWIHPERTTELLLGTDGGVYHSLDRGLSWLHLNHIPYSQFYQVGFDNEIPYNVYGGLQDNGTWIGPSQASGGIRNRHWDLIGGGDGFHAYPDSADPDLVYAESQGGNITRFRRSTGESKDIKPFAKEGEETLRFNWNAPILVSQKTKGTVYFGSQYVHRSRNSGDTWETISPDLTTNDPARQRQRQSGGLTTDNSTAENNTTIFSIAESPVDTNVLWVGTDDGNVQVTRDGGASWANVAPNIPGLSEGTWISQVEASAHDAGTAFVAVDDHRRGDMAPYVYRTEDFGATWTSIVGEGLRGFAHVIRQDPVNPELLFVGTEFGLYLTVDGGVTWARFSGNLPPVPIHDLGIHPREQDLVIGTHGRGIYILDDLTPLRALTAEVLESDFALLPSRPSTVGMTVFEEGLLTGGGYAGENPPNAASVFFYQKKRHLFGDLELQVYDDDGELLLAVPGPKRRGMNRIDWPMQLPPPKIPAATNLAFVFSGPKVPEGTYDFKLVKGKKSVEGKLELLKDPLSPHSEGDVAQQRVLARELYDRVEDLAYLAESLVALRDQAKERAAEVGADGGRNRKLSGQLGEWADDAETLRSQLVSTDKAGWLSGDEKLRENLANLFGAVNGYDGRPSDSQVERAATLTAELAAMTGRYERLLGDRQETLNAALAKMNLEPVSIPSREEWQEDSSGGGSGTVQCSRSSCPGLFSRLLWVR